MHSNSFNNLSPFPALWVRMSHFYYGSLSIDLPLSLLTLSSPLIQIRESNKGKTEIEVVQI